MSTSSGSGRRRRRRRAPSPRAELGAAHVHDPGRRLRLHPDDLYALGGHRGGINERWFSSTTNADNGPGTPATKGSATSGSDDGQRFLLKEAVETAGDLLLGVGGDGRAKAAGTCSASSSTTWGRFRITCTRARRRPSWSAARASPRRTTSRRSTTRSTTTFRTRSWASSPARRKTTCGAASRTGTRGDNGILNLSRAFRLQPGTGWQIDPGHSARARLARHLRAAGEQRRVRDVPVGGRRADRRPGS